MAVFDLFSKRQRTARGEDPDVYIYDDVPDPLRVQLVQLIGDGIGAEHSDGGGVYRHIHKTLCREYGVFSLTDKHRPTPWEEIANYLLSVRDVERVIDIVELSLQTIDGYIRKCRAEYRYHYREAEDPDGIIAEVNTRFREHGVGYEYVSGEILRIDSTVTHADVVKPALALLAGPGYSGANDEYLTAHSHFRHGRYKECLVDCLKCFESAMKVVILARGWPHNERDTASQLVATCINNGLFPSYLESQLGSVRSLLESGVPTIRNRNAGHGQGQQPTVVPQHLAAYALHLTASNVLLLVRSHEGLS
jgi:hypothetical protein